MPRIKVNAKKFAFAPREIRVSKGRRVTLVLSSPEFVHGFSVPDCNVRADGIPGKTIEVTSAAGKASQSIYRCDNFCGEERDKMRGMSVVIER